MTDDNSSNDYNLYHVQVIETDASIRCGLKPIIIYKLIIQSNQIQLEDDQHILFAWPYKYVRRYGYTSNSLSFEAGSKCKTGEGLFIFRNNKSKFVYNQITLNIERIKNLKHSIDMKNQVHNISIASEKNAFRIKDEVQNNDDRDESIPHIFINGCPYAQVIKK